MSFASIGLVWSAVGIALLLAIAYALDITRRRRTIERVGYEPMLKRMTASLSVRRRILKSILMVGAVILCVLSLARPRMRGESIWRQRGIDVAIVMDFSKSMMARDVYPNRYTRMIHEVDDLIDGLDADRVSTVVFAGAAVHFPLTHDHSAVKLLYRGLDPRDLAPGSHLSEAFRVARCILHPDSNDPGCNRVSGQVLAPTAWKVCAGDTATATPEAQEPAISDRARAIVIFTDGEDTEGDARAEVEAAVRQGIEVFVVGVGTVAGELIPEFDENGREIGSKKAPDGALITTRLDQKSLRELAGVGKGGSHYFSVSDAGFRGDLLLAELQRLKKGDLDERLVYKEADIYHWFLFPAFMLLIIEACVSDRRRRVQFDGGNRP